MGKSSKKERRESMVIDNEGDKSLLDAALLAPIAHPLADKKLTKKTLKTVKKAVKHRHVKRGVKEVVKGLRKGDKGLVVLAGNISPIDVLSHIPVLCEDNHVPYVFVPSKEELGGSCSTKRPTCCLMVVPGGKGANGSAHEDYKELYEECFATAMELDKKLLATTAAGGVVA
ncbi:snoRNA-binding protein [Coemansia sp. RSA 989]|nr:H/ACA ribonucleoprotein complex subunit 2 [Coemansia mojavensis]KAJ1743928.1 snoRNA-binding protein [Coemansia sp. RSA 1086]KAJ1753326.1 snoRNA-binding protein [Coemansia sp. RSA 1821]KAJ1867686.1 snoRNA-binding protein [Coemansia sp. RSA 989]KAJ1870326.1 snoRNA-binding protein [Coemansia sp. RSA 990]KAJ2629236.1 snoRNA-binding protein [Coemansia sp. RSA 1290]KAJ2650678.1 snoRNA-binding protein [Coemansia sp. RSA 1250]KAJ2673850.1 snoRNA-binding protein [Coemansia sp. RSA 1085]